jgi:hypothetical protein
MKESKAEKEKISQNHQQQTFPSTKDNIIVKPNQGRAHEQRKYLVKDTDCGKGKNMDMLER